MEPLDPAVAVIVYDWPIPIAHTENITTKDIIPLKGRRKFDERHLSKVLCILFSQKIEVEIGTHWELNPLRFRFTYFDIYKLT
jgi:hypothetical protein